MDESIREALEFEKLGTDDALSAISVEANKEASRLVEERVRSGEPPPKHEILRVRLEELEKEIRMRVDQRRICGTQFSQLLHDKYLEDLRKLLEDRIESVCNRLRSLVPELQPVPSRIDQRSQEAPRLKAMANSLVKQLQVISRKQSRSADQPLVFISCGQFSDEERSLGKAVEELIREHTAFDAYFAENQNSLQGLSENIFDSLKRASGFIAIMHHRGKVTTPSGEHTRASVWIEQEIAIAAFLRFSTDREIPVILYLQVGAEGNEIKREGLREQLRLDPVAFTTSEDVLRDLRQRINTGQLSLPRATPPKRSKGDEARYERAKAVVEKYGEPARIVIRHLQNVEQYRMGNTYDDRLPKGMRGQETRAMLAKLQEEELLTVTVQEGPDPGWTYRIAPGMIAALDELV
jgi:hypothetical protein